MGCQGDLGTNRFWFVQATLDKDMGHSGASAAAVVKRGLWPCVTRSLAVSRLPLERFPGTQAQTVAWSLAYEVAVGVGEASELIGDEMAM